MKTQWKNMTARFLAFGLTLIVGLGALAACQQDSEEPEIASLSDLATLNISVQRGTQGDFLAQDIVGEDNVESQLSQMEKYTDAILELTQGKVDATIMDEGPAQTFLAANDELMILPDDYEIEEYALALRLEDTELVEQIDELLEGWHADGTIDAIKDKYNSDETVNASDIDYNEGASGGTITMGTEAGFKPYEYRVGDGIVGIDVEIAALIAKALDKELVVEDMNFDSLPAALNSGRIDFIAAGMTVTDERKENMAFSIPYVDDAKQVAVIRKASWKGGE